MDAWSVPELGNKREGYARKPQKGQGESCAKRRFFRPTLTNLGSCGNVVPGKNKLGDRAVKDQAQANATNRWKRRGGRATLWGIVFVLLTQQVGGLLLDYRWPDIKFPAAARVLARCPSPSEGPVIVTLGSSRFDGGILPGQIMAQLRNGNGEKS